MFKGERERKMPKQQRSQGKGKPKLKDRGFGQALIKNRVKTIKSRFDNPSDGKKQLISDLDSGGGLDEYLREVELEDADVEVLHVHNHDAILIEPSQRKATIQTLTNRDFEMEQLSIPRKPVWTKEMTPEEVDRNEKDRFLQWRRDIAAAEEKSEQLGLQKKVTPFEKNLEVWRQLWRVVERCDMAIQIVDARNPLLYYTNDLMKYAAEHSPPKPVMLIINKADFLTDYQRSTWAETFESMGIRFVYYSAKIEQSKLDTFADENEIMASEDYDEADIEALANDLSEGWKDKYGTYEGVMNAEHNISEHVEQEGVDGIAAVGKKGQGEEDDDDDDDQSKESYDDYDSEEDGEEDYEEYEEKGKINNDSMTAVCQEEEETERVGEENSEGDSEEEEEETVWGNQTTTIKVKKSILKNNINAVPYKNSYERTRRICRVLTRKELILLMSLLPHKLELAPQIRHQGRICIGLLGYPNVGKSSVINTIMGVSKKIHGTARVAVSSTPGRTKHFQTLMVNEALMLCDCPGLVFPSFMRSHEEMICAGILPINNMRNAEGPANVIASRVQAHLLEATYGMQIKKQLDFTDNPDRPPTGSEILCAYAAVKGYITSGTGRWDEFRSCKELLKDFNNGRVLFVAEPPRKIAEGDTPIDSRRWLADTEKTMMKDEKIVERIAKLKIKEVEASNSRNEDDSGDGIVFGDGQYDDYVYGDEDGDFNFEDGEDNIIYSESGIDVEAGAQSSGVVEFTTQGLIKREHKRGKHWGKKNKKLRDKNPYGDEFGNTTKNISAFSTNRGLLTGNMGRVSNKPKRHDPSQAYGTNYTRPQYPFQHQLSQPKKNSTEL